MKVAINKCFGGFGLSDEGFARILEMKGIEFETVETGSSLLGKQFWRKGMVDQDDGYLYEGTFFSENRSDPELIATLEEMGEAAWGWAAEIEIVEVPDDVKYYISEYDGIETIHEEHRTWG